MSLQYEESNMKIAKIIMDSFKNLNFDEMRNITPKEFCDIINDKVNEALNKLIDLNIINDSSNYDITEVYKILGDKNIDLGLENDDIGQNLNLLREEFSNISTMNFINSQMNALQYGGYENLFRIICGINNQEFNNNTMHELSFQLANYFNLPENFDTNYLINNLSDRSYNPLNEDKIMSLEKIKFHTNIENKQCFICLSDYMEEDNLMNLQCSHYSHWDCMYRWLKITNTCPICRTTIE